MTKYLHSNTLYNNLKQKVLASRVGMSVITKIHTVFVLYPSAKRNYKQPTQQMLNSREFFSTDETKERLSCVTSFLIDDLSKETYEQMVDFRCNRNIANFPQTNTKTLYFRNEYFAYGKDEVLVDCGAFTGDTIRSFRKIVKLQGGAIAKIVAFEPDPENYYILKKKQKDIIAINAGVWDKDTELMLVDGGGLGAKVVSTCEAQGVARGHREGISIPMRAIDECPEVGGGLTFLKMDIEGAELPALIGAKKTIAKYKPKLAICIYHSDEEMLSIPLWIHENFPEYKLFVRQHGKYNTAETVLYGFV